MRRGRYQRHRRGPGLHLDVGAEHWQKPLTSKNRKTSRHAAASVAIGRRSLGHRIRRRTAPPPAHQSDAQGHRTAQARPGTPGSEGNRPRVPGPRTRSADAERGRNAVDQNAQTVWGVRLSTGSGNRTHSRSVFRNGYRWPSTPTLRCSLPPTKRCTATGSSPRRWPRRWGAGSRPGTVVAHDGLSRTGLGHGGGQEGAKSEGAGSPRGGRRDPITIGKAWLSSREQCGAIGRKEMEGTVSALRRAEDAGARSQARRWMVRGAALRRRRTPDRSPERCRCRRPRPARRRRTCRPRRTAR